MLAIDSSAVLEVREDRFEFMLRGCVSVYSSTLAAGGVQSPSTVSDIGGVVSAYPPPILFIRSPHK